MARWKVLVLVGLLLPIVSLLFIRGYSPRLGILWNLQTRQVDVQITPNRSDSKCSTELIIQSVALVRSGRDAGRGPIVRHPGSETPSCGFAISVGYKWVVLIGLGLVGVGVYMRGKVPSGP